jgi:bla regulator protein BlaR1
MNQLVWIFKEVLYLSVFADILILLILLVKKIFKKTLSPKWHYYIWILLLIRLMVPYTPESSFSIYNLFYQAAEWVNIPVNEINNPLQNITYGNSTKAGNTDKSGTPDFVTGNTPFGTTPTKENSTTPGSKQDDTKSIFAKAYMAIKTAATEPVMNILAILWLVIVLVFTVYTVWLNIVFAVKVRSYYTKMEDTRINGILKSCMDTMKIRQKIVLLTTKKLRTPSLYVIRKPKILVSKEYMDQLSDMEIEYIFLHELSHYKRKDIVINWILALLQIVYFFNPLIWYAFFKIHEDKEIACDAEALRYIHEEDYQSYGNTIIKLIRLFSESNFIPATAGIGKNKSSYKRRILMISKFKKSKWTSTLLTVILIIIVAAAGLTGCNKSTEVVTDNTSDITDTTNNAPDTTDTSDTTDTTDTSEVTDETTEPETTVTEENTTESNDSDSENSSDGEPSGDGNFVREPLPQADATDGAPEAVPSEAREAIYYGDWKINKVLAFGSAGTYSREDADALIGKVLSFSADKATNFGDSAAVLEAVSSEPVYAETVLTREDFVSNYRMTFDKLGIDTDAVSQVSVTDADGAVCTFLVIDENTLILSGGGTYFELVRK